MAISTNQKPTIYRNLYETTGPGDQWYTCDPAMREVILIGLRSAKDAQLLW